VASASLSASRGEPFPDFLPHEKVLKLLLQKLEDEKRVPPHRAREALHNRERRSVKIRHAPDVSMRITHRKDAMWYISLRSPGDLAIADEDIE
jgi:hypothetical protein